MVKTNLNVNIMCWNKTSVKITFSYHSISKRNCLTDLDWILRSWRRRYKIVQSYSHSVGTQVLMAKKKAFNGVNRVSGGHEFIESFQRRIKRVEESASCF